MTPAINDFYANYDKGNNKYYIESIYLNKLKNQHFQGAVDLNSDRMYSDPKRIIKQRDIEFRYNNFGFRDEDFKECADILIGGCSQTWGVMLPEQYRFSNMLAEKISSKIHNISFPGNSVDSTIRLVFSYIKEFGNPKYIYLMLPPFERFEFSPDTERFSLEYIKNFKSKVETLLSPLLIGVYNGTMDKVSKAPYSAENIVNLQSVHFWQAQQILMLEQYCDVANIKFAWSTWTTFCGMPETIIGLKKRGLGYESYLDIPFRKWKYNQSTDFDDLKTDESCHLDLKLKSGEVFHAAKDSLRFSRLDGEGFDAHWGAHRNAHVAEILFDYMKNEWDIK